MSVVSLMSTGNLFHAFGPATENARSEETSLVRGTNKSCFAAERSVARPGMSTTESHQFSQIRWCSTVDDMVYQNIEFEIYSSLKLAANAVRKEPVTRGYVVSSP